MKIAMYALLHLLLLEYTSFTNTGPAKSTPKREKAKSSETLKSGRGG